MGNRLLQSQLVVTKSVDQNCDTKGRWKFMTNLEKMNELAGTDANKQQIVNWAYNNRIHVICLHLDEEMFSTMENSVNSFVDSDLYHIDDEFINWDKFLDKDFVE